MTAPVSAQAMENNQRLFVRYAKVFKDNDVVPYAIHAHKLAAWLRDSKAYYTAARPEIIKLLLIAQISLRRALGVEQELTTPFNITNFPRNPMINAYAHLVGTVEPYLPLFVEPALFEHMAGLVATIYPPASSQLPEPPSQSLLSPPTFGDMPIPVSAGIPPPTSVSPGTNNSSFSDPDVQIIDNPYTSISTSGPMDVSNQPAASSSAAKPVETTLKVKAKKRKSVVDFSVLAQRDIEGLMQKKQATQVPTQGATTSVVVKTMSPPVVIPPEPLTLPPSSDSLKLSPEPFHAVAEQALDLQRSPTPPLLNISEIVSQLALSDKPMDLDASMQMNVDEVIQTMRLDQPHEVQEDSHEPANKRLNDENLPTNAEEAGECLGQPEIPAETQLAPTDHSLSSIHPATKMPAMQRPRSVPPEKESNETDVDTTTVLATPSTPATTNGTQVCSLPQSPSTSDDLQVFGSEMRVVASQTGLKQTSRIFIQFEIPELQFALVSKWIARKTSPENVKPSICLTLGCYLNDDLAEFSHIHDDCGSLEKQVSLTKSAWPSHGDLVMSVKYGDTRAIFPLCPPFQITPDGLVDVSEFLSLGQNVIELNQRQDMSRYRFALHAHYPTRGQLKELESRQRVNQSWNDWLLHISRPLNIPLKPTNQAC